MKRLLCNLIAIGLVLTAASSALAGSVEIRLEDGSTWRGEISDMVEVTVREQNVELTLSGQLVKAADLYLIVKGDVAGQIRERTIFRGDIVSMRTIDKGGDTVTKTTSRPARTSRPGGAGDEVPRSADGRELGVFVLPLEGMVGETFRHNEIEMMGEEADEYGPGQIIVLLIDSNGGLVSESLLIKEAIDEVQKRHRVVAWVRKAISAGCSTAMACDEIYFMTDGTAGSVTTVDGSGRSMTEAEGVGEHVQALVDTAVESGYSEHIARAMKLNKYMCSYDKDPVTGEITWYGDVSGEYVLSDSKSNLCFNASSAEHCGFSKGTADTEADLAELLDLPRWHEIGDYGREIAEEWKKTAERAKKEIPRLVARLGYYKSAGDAQEQLGARISILKQLIRWWERAELICMMQGLPPKERLERELEELRRQMAAMRRGGR